MERLSDPFRFSFLVSVLAAAAALGGCGTGVRLPSVQEPISSRAWRDCASDLSGREARALIDDLTLDSKTLLCEGVVLAADGRTDEAIDLLTESGVRDKADHRPHYLMGRILADAGRYEEALAAFERSRKRFPSMEVPSERIGRTVLDKKGPDEARRFLGMAQGRGLCPYGCKGLLADLQHRAGDDGAAESLYGEMVKDAPDEPAAYVGLASLRNAKGLYADEAELLAKARDAAHFADLSPAQRADVLYGLGFAQYNAGRFAQARAAIAAALALDGKRADWHVLAGFIELKDGDADKALAAFEKARDLDPRLAAAHTGVGDSLVAAGRPGDAASSFEKARDLDPTNAVIVLKAAEAKALAGELDTARKLVAEARAIDKEHLPPEIMRRLDKLLAGQAEAGPAAPPK
ncbi:MAG: tetratricopeptide repeat protein [Deltaproteobacteria bacterium]|nr:tetratricopeptide repeat protein [Deltaproteobacteria bacterium]